MRQKIIEQFLKNKYVILIFIIAVAIRLIGIGSSTFNDDAHFWYTRSIKFHNAVIEKNWAGTFQNPKPGVTLMWLTGFTYDWSLTLYSQIKGWRPPLYFAGTYSQIHFMVMLPIILIISLSYLLFTVTLDKIFNKRLAVIAFIIIAFEPFLVGINQWLHVDSTLLAFMLISLAFLMTSFSKSNINEKLFILSAIAGGLALLTKTQSFYLFLFVPYCLILKSRLYSTLPLDLKSIIRLTLMWWGVAVGVFAIFFPAMWVEPLTVLKKIYEEDWRVISQGQNGVFDNHGALWYPYILMLRSSPLLIIGFIAGIILAFNRRRQESEKWRYFIILLVSYIGWYLLMMTIPAQKIDRYLLPIMPVMAVFAAYVVTQLPPKLQYLVLGLSILYSLTYFNGGDAYFNPLVGGRITAQRIYKVETKGERLPQIGADLNRAENAIERVVVSTYVAQSLRPFFLGAVYDQNERTPEGVTVDYALTPFNIKLPVSLNSCSFKKEYYYHGDLWWTLYTCPQITLNAKED